MIARICDGADTSGLLHHLVSSDIRTTLVAHSALIHRFGVGGLTDLVGGLVPGCWGGVGVGGSPTAGVGLSCGSSGWARWGCVGGWSGRDGWASTGGPQGGELVLPGPVGGVVQDAAPAAVGDAGWDHDEALADGGHARGAHAPPRGP